MKHIHTFEDFLNEGVNKGRIEQQKGKPFRDVTADVAAAAIADEYESDLDEEGWGYALKWVSGDFKLKPGYDERNSADTQKADEIWKILQKRYGFTKEN